MVSELLKILEKYGAMGALALVCGWVVIKIVSVSIEKWVKKSDTDSNTVEPTEDDLKFHPFFSNAQYRLMVEIPDMEFNPTQPVRQKLCRDLLYHKITALHDSFFAHSEKHISGMSTNEWATYTLKTVREMTRTFKTSAHNAGIPLIVVEKFNRWHEPTLSLINDYISVIANSNMYSSNIARTTTLLMVMNLVLITTLGDAERTLKELNGELSGMTYDGSIIE